MRSTQPTHRTAAPGRKPTIAIKRHATFAPKHAATHNQDSAKTLLCATSQSEWDRRALEVLREPLESGVVTISRAARQSEFPARFQLVAAMNPCPCGWAGDPSGRCRCNIEAIRRYRGRISRPLFERVDLHLEVPRLPPSALRPDAPAGECSEVVRLRVVAARERQRRRAGTLNSRLDQAQTMAACRLAPADQHLLEQAIGALQLSARSMHRILQVARTSADLADLADCERIGTAHVTEAIGYRKSDRHT